MSRQHSSINLLFISLILFAVLFSSKLSNCFRLPTTIKPLLYNLNIETNIHKNDFNFNGEVLIKILIENRTNEIILHSKELQFRRIFLYDSENNTIPVEHTVNRHNESLTIISKNSVLQKGEHYSLQIGYTAKLRTDMRGFYNSSYQMEDGRTIYLATTMFEPIEARYAFPCFDEPGMKSEFIISIKHGKNYTALSNMPVDGKLQENSDGTVTTKFQKTPLMSTYLLAFIVSNFESTSNTSKQITQRLFSKPGTQNQHEFGLKFGLEILTAFEDYFEIKYSLPKMDQVAIADISAVAMENWGLIVYSEEVLLESNTKSQPDERIIASTSISHEMAHQWFGNLVSPTWWTYIWLNEGFSTFYGFKGIDLIHPDWDIWDYFLIKHYQLILSQEYDKLPYLSQTVETTHDIEAISYFITYSKASCIIRMIEHALTEKTFKKAIQHYLKKMSFKAASELDLIDSFLWATKEDHILQEKEFNLKEFIESWTQQNNVPILTVTRDYDQGTFNVTQSSIGDDDSSKTWWIPFNIITRKYPDFQNTTPDYFLAKVKTFHVSKQLANSDWLLLNKQQTGYYRVNYDERNWNLITEALITNPNSIHKYNRAQLIDDALYLGNAKKLPFKILLNLLKFMKNEKEYVTWRTAYSAFADFDRYFNGDENYPILKLYLHDLVEPFFEEIGIFEKSTDSTYRKILRSYIIDLACSVGVRKCLELTNQYLTQQIEMNFEIDINSNKKLLTNSLKTAKEKQFSYLFQQLLNSTDLNERAQLISILSFNENPNLLEFYLQSSMNMSSEINFDIKERVRILECIYENGELGMTTVLNFLNENYQHYGRYLWNPLLISLRKISARIVNNKQKEQLISLLDKLQRIFDLTEQDYEFIILSIDKNLDDIKDYQENLRDWLNENDLNRKIK